MDPIQATFGVEVVPAATGKSLREQADSYPRDFSIADPATFTWSEAQVGGARGWMVEPVPVMLAWRILFIEHNGQLYRLMYRPVDMPEAKTDVEELTQTTLGSFTFLK